jgi:hypothetical protein
MWVMLLILILIVLSVMFGGFQKGTKDNSGLGRSVPAVTAAVTAAVTVTVASQSAVSGWR